MSNLKSPILIIDDAEDMRLLIESLLKSAGYTNLSLLSSAEEAFDCLGLNGDKPSPSKATLSPKLILTDIAMPEIDGIELCKRIKSDSRLSDIPIIMISALGKSRLLEAALEAGAMDYITKPVDKIELVARIRSAIKLKLEIDKRRSREQELIHLTNELEEANKRLKKLSLADSLTGIANRRHFEEHLKQEWTRAIRTTSPLSLIFIDADYFKAYNDTFGHQRGDNCLKQIAEALVYSINRPGDLVGRYGGEEFVIVLPNLGSSDALTLAERLRKKIESLKISHPKSKISNYVTISVGAATTVPGRDQSSRILVHAADKALYSAKKEGRNRVCTAKG